MHRTAQVPNAAGLYVDGDAGNAFQGTPLVAADRNTMQEELVAIVLAAGLALDTGNNAQVLAAILALVDRRIFVSGAAPAAGNLTGTLTVVKLYVTVPAGKRLRLKRCRAATSGNDNKAWAQVAGEAEWTSTAFQYVDEAPDAVLFDNSGGGAPASRVVSFGFKANQASEPYDQGDGVWFALSIE